MIDIQGCVLLPDDLRLHAVNSSHFTECSSLILCQECMSDSAEWHTASHVGAACVSTLLLICHLSQVRRLHGNTL